MSLRLVEFDPNDYKLGEVLSTRNGDILTSPESISAVLSLYFQWPEKSKASAYFNTLSKPTSIITLDYDKEERSLTQLLVKIEDNIEHKGADKIFVRLELFNGCYEFESNILDVFEDNGNWAIISPPAEMKSVKIRRSHRYSATQRIKATLHSNTSREVSIKSLTLNGLVTAEDFPSETNGEIEISGRRFRVSYARKTQEGTAFNIYMDDDKASAHYFDIYRKVAYPSMIPRKEVDLNKLYDLFVETGFFGNFGSSLDEEDRRDKAIQCWESLVSAEHNFTADFALKESNELIGSSSCALAYKNKEREYWVFHQLCAKKNEDNLDLTGDLYAWRAEYLWMRKSQITSVFWFRSKSRWLERIYVKFAMQNPEQGFVRPAHVYSYLHKANQSSRNIDAFKENYGHVTRSYIHKQDVIGGLGPDYTHINRNMNLIQTKNSWNKVQEAAEHLCNSLNRDSAYFRVVLEEEVTPDFPGQNWNAQTSVDRHAEITKEGMLDFIACLRHSIEVTKKKQKKVG